MIHHLVKLEPVIAFLFETENLPWRPLTNPGKMDCPICELRLGSGSIRIFGFSLAVHDSRGERVVRITADADERIRTISDRAYMTVESYTGSVIDDLIAATIELRAGL